MFYIYKASVFIHILSAMFWIGGMLFTVAVLVPITRNKVLKPTKTTFYAIMKRFSRLSWILFPILILTGGIQLWARGYTLHHLMSNTFWESHFGTTLAFKLTTFALVLIISGLHDFWLGPKATLLMDEKPQDPRTQKIRKVASWIGRLNLLFALLILYFAVTLVRG